MGDMVWLDKETNKWVYSVVIDLGNGKMLRMTRKGFLSEGEARREMADYTGVKS